MKTWEMNLYGEYFEKTKNDIKNWECRRDNKPYSVGDKIIFTSKTSGEKIEREIIDIFKTNDIYKNSGLAILTLSKN